jgi:arylsulfatase A-like enzyme
MPHRITRRGFLTAAGLAPLALAAAQDRPNIILAMTDDQGWGDTSYNGHPVLKTPHLDAMAAAGVRFDRFYAAYSVCSPTRASLMTGRHPTRYRCFSWGCPLPSAETSIAEAVKPAGYVTGHFGKWHLGEIPGQAGPFNRSNTADVGGGPLVQGFDESFSEGNWFDVNPQHLHHNGKPVGTVEGDTSDIIVDRAIAWIRAQQRASKPFLAVVWFPSPHGPYKAIEKDRAPYVGKPGNADYLGEMAGVDRNIGKLRAALRELRIEQNTLFWFNSDNGAVNAGSPGGLSGSKSNLMEGGIRVPGIVEWPARVKKPFRTSVPAGTVDIFPTVLDCLGLKPASAAVGPLDGISLRPLFEGKMKSRPSPLMFSQRDLNGDIQAEAVIDNDWKFYRGRQYFGYPSKPQGEPGEFLFNLKTDPVERINLASTEPAVVKKLSAALATWQRSVEKDLTKYPARQS